MTEKMSHKRMIMSAGLTALIGIGMGLLSLNYENTSSTRNPYQTTTTTQTRRITTTTPMRDYVPRQNVAGSYTVTTQTKKQYANFPYQDELQMILANSQKYGIEPEMLMAIRCAENGKNYAYGVLPRKPSEREKFKDKETQCKLAAQTIANNEIRRQRAITNKDQIDYLGDVYCPVGAENDPRGLNKNWKGNVRKYYTQFKGER